MAILKFDQNLTFSEIIHMVGQSPWMQRSCQNKLFDNSCVLFQVWIITLSNGDVRLEEIKTNLVLLIRRLPLPTSLLSSP